MYRLGQGDGIGGAFVVTAGESATSGGRASVIAGLSSASSGGGLNLAGEEGVTCRQWKRRVGEIAITITIQLINTGVFSVNKFML
jgi:hypothetical protein